MNLISREAIKGTLEEHRNLFVMAWEGHIMSNYDKSRMDEISACIGEVQNCPSAFEGMTNGEVMKAVFESDNVQFCENGSWIHIVFNGMDYSFCPVEFWNAPYQKGGEA